ncbi:MAG: sulfite reductase [Sphingobacteriales bacterium 41-5]|nr:MAG: sulfite reductase [Sphingobacteriales bacterium 41-5]
MLSEEKLLQVNDFTAKFTREELIWLNGYIAGIAGISTPALNGAVTNSVPSITKKLTLVYGTETGNSKSLAVQLAGIAKKKNVAVKLAALDQYRLTDLAKEENFFVVISTQGEGDPPIPAQKFYDHIHQTQIDLKKMKFGVLGLGDTSYAQFCKTGEDVDARLEALGAHRVLPLKKCDVDYETDALHWIDNVVSSLQSNSTAKSITPSSAQAATKPAGKKIYKGTVLTSINLNDIGSNKETYHIEISSDEDIDYLPGDVLGIVPHNKPQLIANILELTGIDPQLEIDHPKAKGTVKELLGGKLNISYLLKSTVKQYATLTGQEIAEERLSLYDILRLYPLNDKKQFEEVIKMLSIQAPRLYSVSSSPAAHGNNEIHITVVKDRFFAGDERRSGVGSKFLAGLAPDDTIDFFIQKSKHFRLPQENKDVIMVGPGTGIAPFRSFIFERDALGTSGKNWLFFGEQYFVSDFLYQTELQNFLQTGTLTNLDLAFSRDQQEKIYVQDRMKEKGKELYDWFERGAYFYISGKRDPMSKDVETTLIEIFKEHGNKTEEEAKAYLKKLDDEGRYEKDVY